MGRPEGNGPDCMAIMFESGDGEESRSGAWWAASATPCGPCEKELLASNGSAVPAENAWDAEDVPSVAKEKTKAFATRRA